MLRNKFSDNNIEMCTSLIDGCIDKIALYDFYSSVLIYVTIYAEDFRQTEINALYCYLFNKNLKVMCFQHCERKLLYYHVNRHEICVYIWRNIYGRIFGAPNEPQWCIDIVICTDVVWQTVRKVKDVDLIMGQRSHYFTNAF